MNRIALTLGIAVAVGAAAIYVYRTPPVDSVMSVADQEAAANSNSVVLETETPRDETITSAAAEREPVADLEVSSAIDHPIPAQNDLLTLEGYDVQQTRSFLVQSDLPVQTRNRFLIRLREAVGDEDELAAVLKELRAELQSS